MISPLLLLLLEFLHFQTHYLRLDCVKCCIDCKTFSLVSHFFLLCHTDNGQQWFKKVQNQSSRARNIDFFFHTFFFHKNCSLQHSQCKMTADSFVWDLGMITVDNLASSWDKEWLQRSVKPAFSDSKPQPLFCTFPYMLWLQWQHFRPLEPQKTSYNPLHIVHRNNWKLCPVYKNI